MSDANQRTAPVSGSCARCGCALGYRASLKADEWYCCGACSGSDRCVCGCKPEHTREPPVDVYVPTRRMFAARLPLLGPQPRPLGRAHSRCTRLVESAPRIQPSGVAKWRSDSRAR